MEGWVDLNSLITPRPWIEPTTAWSKVRCPNRCATRKVDCNDVLMRVGSRTPRRKRGRTLVVQLSLRVRCSLRVDVRSPTTKHTTTTAYTTPARMFLPCSRLIFERLYLIQFTNCTLSSWHSVSIYTRNTRLYGIVFYNTCLCGIVFCSQPFQKIRTTFRFSDAYWPKSR